MYDYIENNWLMGFLLFVIVSVCNLISPLLLKTMTKKEAKGLKALKLLTLKLKKHNEVQFED